MTRAAPPPAGRASRILVVDDDTRVNAVLAELLRGQGHRVWAFTDPRQALAHLAAEPADLLVTDLGMPEMLGWDVARLARERWPGLRVLVVTGWGDQLDLAQVFRHGVEAVLTKPFRAADLFRAVAELLSGSNRGYG